LPPKCIHTQGSTTNAQVDCRCWLCRSRRNFGASNNASANFSAGRHDHASSLRVRPIQDPSCWCLRGKNHHPSYPPNGSQGLPQGLLLRSGPVAGPVAARKKMKPRASAGASRRTFQRCLEDSTLGQPIVSANARRAIPQVQGPSWDAGPIEGQAVSLTNSQRVPFPGNSPVLGRRRESNRPKGERQPKCLWAHDVLMNGKLKSTARPTAPKLARSKSKRAATPARSR
jgi:hypothetical protein